MTGAGGFIGGHLAGDLIKKGHKVRAVDQKPLTDWWQIHPEAESLQLDMKDLAHCRKAVAGLRRRLTSPRTWAGWALSNSIRPCACSRC